MDPVEKDYIGVVNRGEIHVTRFRLNDTSLSCSTLFYWCISIKENFRNLFFVNLLGAVFLLLWISEMY